MATLADPLVPLAADTPDFSQDTVGVSDNQYGDWNENLPEDLQAALTGLAKDICDEFKYPRRLQVMKAWQARSFWRELQHLNWNWEGQCWDVLGPAGGDRPGDPNQSDSAVLYTTNIYQGFGDAFIAIITQAVPALRFEPEDPDDAADVETARASDSARRIIQHDNDPIKLMTKAAYFAWTDGLMCAWTRWANDKRTGKPRVFQTLYGAMEVKIPVIDDEQDDYEYLQFSREYSLSEARDKVNKRNFPATDQQNPYWKKITGGMTGSGENVYERIARISVKQGIAMKSAGGDAYKSLVTTQRTWMRPSIFYRDCISDDKRDTLIEMFPDGCYVETDNGVYVGSRNANLADEWAIENVMEGDGSNRSAKGSSLISVQERANDILNCTQDVYEKTQPASHWDDQLFDIDAMRRQISIPGARYGLDYSKLPAGDQIQSHVFFEPEATVSPDMLTYSKTLITDIPELITGISAILFGGGAGDKSGKALAIQQSAAMGRVGLSFRVMKRLYARMMEQGVRCMARNSAVDTSIGIPDANGQIERISVRVEDLLGSIRCYPEVDENIPESWTAQKQTWMALQAEGNLDPNMKAVLMHPKNQKLAKKYTGLTDLVIPTANSEDKQIAEIRILTDDGAPIPQPLALVPIPNPAVPGAVVPTLQPQQPKSSVPIDPDYDDHAAEFQAVQDWINSPEGQKVKQTNPLGFLNVRLHGLEHKAIIDAQQKAALQTQIAMEAIKGNMKKPPQKGSPPKPGQGSPGPAAPQGGQ